MPDEHPAPWSIKPLGDGGYHVVDAAGVQLSPATLFGNGTKDYAHWRHVVACVNACAAFLQTCEAARRVLESR